MTKLSKITNGRNILQNIEILGSRNKLAPSGSILPNSFSHLIFIFSIQYFALSLDSLIFSKSDSILILFSSFSSKIFSFFLFWQAFPKIYGRNMSKRKNGPIIPEAIEVLYMSISLISVSAIPGQEILYKYSFIF